MRNEIKGTVKILRPDCISPELQHVASIANLLAYIDGSTARACVACGAIFMVPSGSARMFCEPCQGACEEAACCDAPNYRTIQSRSDGNTAFSTRVCESCGHRKEVEH